MTEQSDKVDKLTEEIQETLRASLAVLNERKEHKMVEVTALKIPSRDDFNGDEGARIARLTTEAVLKSAEQASRDIMASVAQAEGVLKILREEGEQLSQDIRHHAEGFAARIGKTLDGMRDITLAMREKREGLGAQFNMPDKRAIG